MQRFFLTCAISLGLLAALQLYAQFMSPLTRAIEPPRRRRPAAVSPVQKSNASTEAAQLWLTNEEWLKTAAIRWQRSEHSFIYAQTIEAANRGNLEASESAQGDTVRMRPFAMIWKNAARPDEPPLTIVAESSRVRFENKFFDENPQEESSISLSGGDAGRVVSAALEGVVRVTGPDGLVFEGQDFIFLDGADSAELYSDHAVNFRYGPPRQGQPVQVRGTSAVGMRVEFAHDPNSPFSDDMPRVSERPKSAELGGRVAIDFITEETGAAVKTRVTSEGPFQYVFETNAATFREKVLVSRPQGQNLKDEIECNMLALMFGEIAKPRESNPHQIQQVGNARPPQANSVGLISRVELKNIRALASQKPGSVTRERVTLRSPVNGLECELDDLQYDAGMRLFTLTDPDRVNVRREVAGQLQKFDAPKIEIRHSADQQLEQLSGVGAGQFSHRSDAQSPGDPDIWARWKDRLDLAPNPQEKWTELTIRGTATVGQLDQMQFSGQTIQAWLPLLDDLDPGALQPGVKKRAATQTPRPDQVPIRRIQAVGNVSFLAPGVIGRRIEQVDIQITPGQIIPWNRPERKLGEDAGAEARDPVLDGEPLVFECARILGNAVFDAATQTVDIRELHGIGRVLVFRTVPDSDSIDLPFEQQPIRVTAHEFSATNEGGTRQVLTLRGVVDEQGRIREPVLARFGDVSIEGPRIVIDREKNLATIEIERTPGSSTNTGQGVLRFPVDQDFSGNTLSAPVIATIVCLEKITFDGQRATFLQNVKAKLLDNTVKAERMTAVLNGRIDFSADRPQTNGLAIESLKCEDKVSVEMYDYDKKNELIEIVKARLDQFETDQATGKFHGQGPGQIEDWRRTGTRRMLVQSQGSAQSNRPADSDRDFPWEYVVIDFKGSLDGSLKDQWGKLNDEVQLLYAPVKNAYLIFKHNDLSGEGENVGNAVWVGSDQMTVTITGDRAAGRSQSATVEALGNAEMEGRNFYARAYSLRYEQAKEMFTLLGKGRDKATLNVQRSPGEPFSKLPAQTIRIFPSKQEVSVDGAETFTTTFGGE